MVEWLANFNTGNLKKTLLNLKLKISKTNKKEFILDYHVMSDLVMLKNNFIF